MATKTKTEQELIREAMGLLGKRTSERKRAAVAKNNVGTRFKAKPLEALECRCGKCPDDPKTYCPRGRAILRRQKAEGEGMTSVTKEPNIDFTVLAAQKREKLHALITAPESERQAALQANAPVAAAYYATPEGREELSDWRAIQGEPFHE